MNKLFQGVSNRLVGLILLPQYFSAKKSFNKSRYAIESFKFIGKLRSDPTEFFSHYDAYSYWLVQKLDSYSKMKILDLGGLKITNAIMSIHNDVWAITLKNPDDRLSNVNYIVSDVSNGIPIEDHSIDIFTSLASLHLIGMGRYGDKLNFQALENTVSEINRVLKKDSEIMISIPIGSSNCLLFNSGLVLKLNTWLDIFESWKLEEILIDNSSCVGEVSAYKNRFSTDLSDLDSLKQGSFKTCFLHLSRNHNLN